MKDVFLKEIEGGYLVLVDEDGQMIGPQKAVSISQSLNSLTQVKVLFELNPKTQMYKETNQ